MMPLAGQAWHWMAAD